MRHRCNNINPFLSRDLAQGNFIVKIFFRFPILTFAVNYAIASWRQQNPSLAGDEQSKRKHPAAGASADITNKGIVAANPLFLSDVDDNRRGIENSLQQCVMSHSCASLFSESRILMSSSRVTSDS
jgi:hypothetical protein